MFTWALKKLCWFERFLIILNMQIAKFKFYLFLFPFCFYGVTVYPQYFMKAYIEFPANEPLYSLWSAIPTVDSGYIYTSVTSTPSNRIHIIKCDSSGQMVWARLIGRSDGYDLLPSELINTKDGNIMLGFIINSPSVDSTSLLKMNQSGNVLWTKTYSNYGQYDFRGMDLAESIDNGFYIANSSYVFKVDSIGNLVWARDYKMTHSLFAKDIIATSDSGFIIAYHSRVNNGVKVLKCDSQGSIKWSNIYYDFKNFILPQIVEISNGYIISKGTSLIKLDYAGDSLWTRTYSIFRDSTTLNSLSLTSNNNELLLTYLDRDTISGLSYGCYAKADTLGSIIWCKKISQNGFNNMYSYLQGYLLVGDMWHITRPLPLIVKTNSEGLFGCGVDSSCGGFTTNQFYIQTDTIADSALSFTSSISALNVISESVDTLNECLLLSTEVPAYMPQELYSNPAVEQITINGLHQNTIIEIFNIVGQVVYFKAVMQRTEVININHYPAGVYICKINSTTETRFYRFYKIK